MNFINKLKQTISFKLLSVSGYFMLVFVLYSFYCWVPLEIKNSIDPEFGGLGAILIVTLIIFYYYILIAILTVIGIIEYLYKKYKKRFKENRITIFTFIFIMGLLCIILLTFFILKKIVFI